MCMCGPCFVACGVCCVVRFLLFISIDANPFVLYYAASIVRSASAACRATATTHPIRQQTNVYVNFPAAGYFLDDAAAIPYSRQCNLTTIYLSVKNKTHMYLLERSSLCDEQYFSSESLLDNVAYWLLVLL
jgi:hypothetical protein